MVKKNDNDESKIRLETGYGVRKWSTLPSVHDVIPVPVRTQFSGSTQASWSPIEQTISFFLLKK